MFVKICGMTDPSAVRAAVAAGADAVGFVFAPSSRQVSPERARELAADIPSHVVRVAVFHHPARAAFERVLAVFAPDWVQTDLEDLRELDIPEGVISLPVIRNGRAKNREQSSLPHGLPMREQSSLPHGLPMGEAPPTRVLFEGARSGTGTTADWDEARVLAATTEVVLAGGLRADNVAAAIDHVRPFGVDVSTGVEIAPGQKDPGKISEFVARVRALET